jgi:hypothetical protein
MFIFILGLSAFLVAGCAAFFSVLGIATLFSGSYYQVMVMAGSLELGKLVATSYLYRYWRSTNLLLKTYLMVAVLVLMGITSLGIFGYLSAAYQVNSAKYVQVEQQVDMLEEQKSSFEQEVTQIKNRIDTLNNSRAAQEKRLTGLSSKSSKIIYEDIQKSGEEIKKLTTRLQDIQTLKIQKDTDISALQIENNKVKDISTFKYVAQIVNKPLDTIVIVFIIILIFVFDPLAVSLILAFNVATKAKGVISKQETQKELIVEKDTEEPVNVEKKKNHLAFTGTVKQ